MTHSADGAGSPSPQPVDTRQIILTLLIVALAFWVAFTFLMPLTWAAVLAIAEWPLYRRAVERFPNRPITLATAFALCTALFILIPLSLAAAALVQESRVAIDWFNHVQQTGIAMPPWLPDLPLIGRKAAAFWQAHIARPRIADDLLGALNTGSVLGWTQAIGLEILRRSATAIITAVGIAGLLWHGHALAHQSRRIAVRMFGSFAGDFLTRLAEATRATVTGTILVSFFEGAIIGVGYAVTGVPQPTLFATFTIMLALIPFGAWAAFGLASLILVASGSALKGALLFVLGASVMTIGDNVVQPAVVGRAVKLPFLLAMIGAFGGLAQMGLVGLFVGPVVMAALLLIWRQWLHHTPVQSIPNDQA
ncbi:AI-2E family transporter [Novosphingobium sp. BL-8H]|uniref:AI-2E family transporter n=1 Tax=Novosphingobium sp. BL-8H TaxID=3127640 RepID=UPI0037573CED